MIINLCYLQIIIIIHKKKSHYLFCHKFSFKVLILLYYLIQQIIFDLQQIIYILNAYSNNLSTQATKEKYKC